MPLFRLSQHRTQVISLLLFCTALIFYFLAGGVQFNQFKIHLGSINTPTAQQIAFWGWWQDWSALIIFSLACALLSTKEFRTKLETHSQEGSLPLLIGIALIAALLSFAVHYLVLHGVLLTDDESAYIFASQTLAQGQLTAPSPPLKHFFDRVFMINDGSLFPQYFYGWPLLLSLGEFLHTPQAINPLLFGCSTVLLYKIISRKFNHVWGLIGSAAFTLSPLTLINSATYLSHTSSTFFLLATINSYQTVKDTDSRNINLHYVILAVSGSIMVMIRPYTALLALSGIAIAVCYHLIRKPHPWKPIVALAMPTACFATLFFALNNQLNGSLLATGYDHYLQYANQNNFIYSWWNPSPIPREGSIDSLIPPFSLVDTVIATYYGFLRLGLDGLAFPFPFALFAALALGFRTNPSIATGLLLLIVGYARWKDLGIDTYGPMHLSEGIPLAIILLTGLGFALAKGVDSLGIKKISLSGPTIVGALAVSIVITGSLTYTSVRIGQVDTMANNIRIPYEQAQLQGIENALVFVTMPFVSQNNITPMRHFRFWRDNPRPDLSDNILWVNSFGTEENKKLLRFFPDRRAFEMHWSQDGTAVDFTPFPRHN